MRQYVIALIALTGCGRVGFDELPAVPDAPPSFAVTSTTALPLTTIRLSTDATSPPVWSAPDGGTIDAGGSFTAPAVEGDYRVEARVGDVIETATVTVTSAVTPVVLDSAGVLSNATGMAHQHHSAYVDGQWWVWYVTSVAPNDLRVVHSVDGAAWAPGPTLTFTNDVGSSGNNLDVAVQDLGGHHVVHLTAGFETGRGRYHVRATLDGGTLSYGNPQLINQGGNVSPDGPSVVVTPGGTVIDGTGFELTPQTPPLSPCGDGDVEMYSANQLDDGTTSFDAVTWTRTVIWCVPVRVNARRLLADGETVYEIYDDGNQDPNPQNLHYSIRTPTGAWLPDETTLTVPPFVFSTTVTFPLTAWYALIDQRSLHVIRRIGASSDTFEHRVYDLDTGVGFMDAAVPAPRPAVASAGLVLLHYGSGLLLIQLAVDGSLDYSFLGNGAWTPWTNIPLPAATGRFSMSGGEGAGRPLVLWGEQPSAGSFTVSGVVLP